MFVNQKVLPWYYWAYKQSCTMKSRAAFSISSSCLYRTIKRVDTEEDFQHHVHEAGLKVTRTYYICVQNDCGIIFYFFFLIGVNLVGQAEVLFLTKSCFFKKKIKSLWNITLTEGILKNVYLKVLYFIHIWLRSMH